MEQFKRVKVVMLPHNNVHTKITLYKDNDGEPLELSLNTDKLSYHTNQHLYIISDDEIKEGDWFINLFNNVVVQAHNWIYVSTCKKIIATTDTSLKINNITRQLGNDAPNIISLPQPSQQFIEKYIESYNKNEIITDVLVECEMKHTGWTKDQSEYTYDEFLKINPKDNTITIKKLKDSWNREEVVELLKLFENDIKKSINSDDSNNWIKENL